MQDSSTLRRDLMSLRGASNALPPDQWWEKSCYGEHRVRVVQPFLIAFRIVRNQKTSAKLPANMEPILEIEAASSYLAAKVTRILKRQLEFQTESRTRVRLSSLIHVHDSL